MLAVSAAAFADPPAASRPADVDGFIGPVTIKAGSLEATFLGNSSRSRDLSGIDRLINIKDAPGFDAFDPKTTGASAGLNFEHITCGHHNNRNMFTPRAGRFPLRVLSDRSVQLVRRAEDDPWKLDATITYTLVEPHYVDFEFRGRFRDASLFGDRGWGFMFFADYMNDVADPAIHFYGVEKPGAEPGWVRADVPNQHPDWNTGGTWHSVDAKPLELDDNVRDRLNAWTYDWPRFSRPFYYGRAAHDMTYMLMFDRMHSETDEIRFSVFTFKLDKFPRPAWDFQYLIHKVEENRDYGFRGRAVWKKLVSPDDCLKEYEAWRRQLDRETR